MQTDGLAVRAQARCPFLEGVVRSDDADVQGPGAAAPQCTAIGQPIGLAPRQVALACLADDHVVCPRYLRGAGLVTIERSRGPLDRLGGLRRPVVAAALVLLLSAGVTVGYLVAGRGLNLPVGSPLLVAAASPSDSLGPTAAPSQLPEPTASRSPEPSASIGGSLSPAVPSPSPGAGPTGAVEALFPQGGRWDHLTPCPGTSDCYVYTVQSNDTLAAIGETFHVPIKAILVRNPQISNPRLLHAGQKITLPTPTP